MAAILKVCGILKLKPIYVLTSYVREVSVNRHANRLSSFLVIEEQ